MSGDVREAVEFPDDVIRAVCEVETRYIQGFTYSETHVIRDVALPAAEDTLWRGPACTPKNDAAFYTQCEIEKMRRRLTALAPHITALIAAARAQEREFIMSLLVPVEPWRPIETAPKDGTLIWVYVAEREGLPAFQATCAWNEDAGWCCDELRPVTHWVPIRSVWRLPPVPGDAA